MAILITTPEMQKVAGYGGIGLVNGQLSMIIEQPFITINQSSSYILTDDQ